MMQAQTLLLLLASIIFSVVGQLLLKSGTARLADGSGFLVAAFRDSHVLSGLVAWIISTVCWLYVLRVAPLSRSYGLTSLTYILVLVGSVYLFNEPVRRVHVVGTLLIVVGIACLLYGE